MLAITGTRILVEALSRHPGDLEKACAEYEQRQRPYVDRAQATALPGGDLICPATWEALDVRNARLRRRNRASCEPGELKTFPCRR